MKNRKIILSLYISCSSFLLGCTDAEQKKHEKALMHGEQIVKKNCFVCHAQGINGAPIIGNKKMWAPRIEKGKDALFESATNGFGLMPARAGNAELSDEDITSAIAYMISQVTEK